MTAPSPVRPRTFSSAAERRFEIMCAAAISELDPDRAYEMWLEHEEELKEVLAMVKAAVGGAARDLRRRGDSQQEIADRHLLVKRTVQSHEERAPLDV